jgi:hypothetical protein
MPVMQGKIFPRLEVSTPYELHQNWAARMRALCSLQNKALPTLSLTLSLLKSEIGSESELDSGAETIDARFITSLHRIMIMVLMRLDRVLDYN